MPMLLLDATVQASNISFRVKPRVRRNQTPDWPFSFLVSRVAKNQGQDWCMTASNGVSNGADVGFALCDFRNVSQSNWECQEMAR